MGWGAFIKTIPVVSCYMCCMLVLRCNSSPASCQSSSAVEAQDGDSQRMQLCRFWIKRARWLSSSTQLKSFSWELIQYNSFSWVHGNQTVKWIAVVFIDFPFYRGCLFAELDIALLIKTLIQSSRVSVDQAVVVLSDWSQMRSTWRLVDQIGRASCRERVYVLV